MVYAVPALVWERTIVNFILNTHTIFEIQQVPASHRYKQPEYSMSIDPSN